MMFKMLKSSVIHSLLIFNFLLGSWCFASSSANTWSAGLGIGPNLSQLDAVNDDLGSSIGAAGWMTKDVSERQRMDFVIDYFGFKESNQYYLSLSGSYGLYFFKDTKLKPFVLLGLGMGQAKNFPRTENKSQTSPHLFARVGSDELFRFKKLKLGIIADFMYVDLDDKPATSAQLALPMFTLTYNFGDRDEAEQEMKPEPQAIPVKKVTQVLDTDKDGIVDSLDQCPDTGYGTKVNSMGCEKKTIVRKNLRVEFETAKDVIKQDYLKVVDDFAEFLIKANDVQAAIEGHTDNVGRRNYNLKLSQKRADAVKKRLIEKGVNADRIVAIGYGPDKPETSNATLAGRQKNRRVIAILKSAR